MLGQKGKSNNKGDYVHIWGLKNQQNNIIVIFGIFTKKGKKMTFHIIQFCQIKKKITFDIFGFCDILIWKIIKEIFA